MAKTPTHPAPAHRHLIDPAEKSISKRVGGSDRAVFNDQIVTGALSAVWVSDSSTEEQRNKLIDATLIGLMAFKPEDEIEGMLAAQATAMHNGAMECARRAMISNQGFEAGMAYRKAATQYSRAFTDLLAALDRKRGKGGQQKVTVEHVHVHAGGKAIVGTIEASQHGPGGGAGKIPSEEPHAPDLLAAPSSLGTVMPTMRRPDAEPATLPWAGDAQRPLPDARRGIYRPADG